jgi:hypothetical protein
MRPGRAGLAGEPSARHGACRSASGEIEAGAPVQGYDGVDVLQLDA